MVPGVLFIAVGLAAGLPGTGCNVTSSPLPSSPPIRRYVETEVVNKQCIVYRDESDSQPDEDAVPCPPGRHVTGLEGGPYCELCPFGPELKTYMPDWSYCELCILCKVCPDGYEVEENCTRMNQTKCKLIELNLTPGKPSTMVPPSVSGPPDDPGPTAADDGDDSPPSDPLGPEFDKEIHFDWVSKILVPILVLFIVVLLLIAAERCWRVNQLEKEKTERERVVNEAGLMLRSRTRPVSLSTASENAYSDRRATTELSEREDNGSLSGAGGPNGLSMPNGSNEPNGAGVPNRSSIGSGAIASNGFAETDGPDDNNDPIGSSVPNGGGGPTVEWAEDGGPEELQILMPPTPSVEVP